MACWRIKKKTLIEQPVSAADYSGIKVFVDPGHGGADSGAAFNSVLEKNINLAVGLKLRDLLKGKGFTVAMSREDDSAIAISEIVKKANAFFSDAPKEKRLFISIHINSAATASCTNLTGSWAIYPNTNPKTKGFALTLLESIKSSGITPNVRIGTDTELTNFTNLGVLRECTDSCTQTDSKALIELEFICNAQNAEKISSEAWQAKAAQALYDGTAKFAADKGLAGSGEWHENIYATAFWPGSVGSSNENTAYGTWAEGCPNESCVALPLRVGKGKMVEVCKADNSKCMTVPVGDVGPWCTTDYAYVQGTARPFAETNKGKVLGGISGTLVCNNSLKSNGAGIDLAKNAAIALFGRADSGYVRWRFV